MKEVKLKEGRLTLKNGELTIKGAEIVEKKQEKTESQPLRLEEEAKAPKTAAERQKDLYERRKTEGWRKAWINPETLALANDLGGIQEIPAEIARLRAAAARSWWQRLLNY